MRLLLSGLFEIIGGGTPKTQNPDYWDGHIPWISVTDMSNDFRYIDITDKTITDKGLKESSTKLLQPDDIIISARGTVGIINQIRRPMAFNQTCYGLRARQDIVDYNYLYYLMISQVPKLQQIVHGAIFNTITRDSFDLISVELPALETQKEIAHILGTLDDKIELNRKMNKTLEDIAQTLFKHWLIDFEFPNDEGMPYKSSGGDMIDSELGPIPKGWRIGSLDDIASFLNGLALQKYPPKGIGDIPVIKIAQLNCGNTQTADLANSQVPPEYIVNDSDVLFSWSGSLDVKIWCGGKGALNQHLYKVTSKKFPKWFYYFWLKEHLEEFRQIAASKATTMGHIQRRQLTEAKVIIPDKTTIEYAHDIINGILRTSDLKFIESKICTKVKLVVANNLFAGWH